MKIFSFWIIVCTIFFFSSCESPKRFEMKDGLIYQTGTQNPYTGKIESFYTDGKKNFVKNYSDGKLNGTTTHWFENGQKRIELNFRDNLTHGEFNEWYENGQLKEKSFFENAMQTGEYISYHSNGQIRTKRIYMSGEKLREENWNPDGSEYEPYNPFGDDVDLDRDQPAIQITNIEIESEICGIFTKSIIEMTLYNTHDQDNLESDCKFYTNKNTIVKNLWLEMVVYGEQRLDPAILEIKEEGEFNLRVFPFFAKQSRKVKIEMYSILDKRNGKLNWSFRPLSFTSNKKTIHYHLINNLPKNTKIIDKSLNEISIPDLLTGVKTEDYIDLTFSIPDSTKNINIYNDNYQLFWNNQHKEKKITDTHDLKIVYKASKDEIFRELITNIKANKFVKIEYNFFEGYNGSEFEKRFIRYLVNIKNAEIYCEDSYWNHKMMYDWEINDSLYLCYNNFTQELVLTSEKQTVKESIYCSFIDEFIDYGKLLKSDKYYQAEKGYLTDETVKVVLEDIAEVNAIKKKALENENDSRREAESARKISANTYRIRPSKQNTHYSGELEELEIESEVMPEQASLDNSEFWSLPPRLPITFDVLEKLTWKYYPVRAKLKGYQSTVRLNVLCTWQGNAEDVKVVSEISPGNGFADAAKKILKGIKLVPASRNDVFINSRMNIEFQFKMNKSCNYNKPENKNGKFIQYYDKYFSVAEIEGIELPLEKDFKIDKAIKIKYASDEHFELLYDKPDLIKYCLDFDNIALIVDGKHYLIMDK